MNVQLQRQQARLRQRLWLAALACCLLAALLASLSTGTIRLHPLTWWQGIPPLEWQILTELRLPRALLAILLGAGLAVAGCVLQTLLHNPLAEPGIIGVSSGASLAAILALFLSYSCGVALEPWWLSAAACTGALLVTLCLLALCRKGRLDNSGLLLLGVALGMGCGAISSWLLYFSADDAVRAILFWMMGSLSYGQALAWGWWLPYLLAILWLLHRRHVLSLLQLGDYQAQLMGLELKRLRRELVLVVCLLCGLSVALAGAIGFIGLVVPHLMRRLGRDGPEFVLPASALGGALLLLLADLLSRSLLSGGELPIGVVTASLGAPLFIYLLVRRDA